MSNNPPHMWKYWRDEYGYRSAVIEYYSDDSYASRIVEKISDLEKLLDAHFKELEGDE